MKAGIAFFKVACLCALVLASFSARAQEYLKVVTYNIHGGHGNAELNLQKFNALLTGDEQVLCLQEIKPDVWPLVQAAFPDFAYSQVVWRKTTDALGLFETRQQEAGAILSKRPFVSEAEQLVQIDPAGDLWERKAGFVRIQTGDTENDSVLIACYHNTYNFNDNDFESEQAGMRRFRELSLQLMQQNTLASDEPYVLLGDFNVFEDKIPLVLPDAPYTYSVGRDHVATNIPFVEAYQLNTRELNTSDHDAVTVSLNLTLPSSDTSDDPPKASGAGLDLTLLVILLGLALVGKGNNPFVHKGFVGDLLFLISKMYERFCYKSIN